jgi:hypothetical protein
MSTILHKDRVSKIMVGKCKNENKPNNISKGNSDDKKKIVLQNDAPLSLLDTVCMGQ